MQKSSPSIPPENFQARREKFLAQLPPNSLAIFVSNPERTRSNDTEYKYRQSSNFIYLSDFPEPESAMILTNISDEPSYILFVRPKDRAQEIWTGIRAGVEGAKTNYACDEAYTTDQFNEIITRLIAKASNVYHKFDRNSIFDTQIFPLWNKTQKPLYNPEDIVNELRLFKDATEIEVMQHAANLSAKAHCLAMQACSPGRYEYQLASLIEASCTYNGAQALAYGSIVAGGNNAIVLHYVSNSAQLADGDLVLIDAACEYLGYASDITRTFPVNGKFTNAQKEIYELVLEAQIAAIEAAKPGVALSQVHNAACQILTKGLVKLKILPESALVTGATGAGKVPALHVKAGAGRSQGSSPEGSPEASLGLKSFYPHGTSHWLGIDVHDVGSYKTSDGTRTDAGQGKQRILEPGMACTVEPGLYFDANDERIPKQYRGIGIRIEDDIVITNNGNIVLTSGVPKTIKEIEKLMAQKISFEKFF